MTAVPDPAIVKHWIVCPFGLSETPGSTPEEGEPGQPVTIDNDELLVYPTELAARNAAKALAASHPTQYYVVYEALWYAHTDITPVALRRVGGDVSL